MFHQSQKLGWRKTNQEVTDGDHFLKLSLPCALFLTGHSEALHLSTSLLSKYGLTGMDLRCIFWSFLKYLTLWTCPAQHYFGTGLRSESTWHMEMKC